VSGYEFIDEKFMSAVEKEAVLNNWVRFLKNGCKREQFTNRLYKHLINHCMFIAHYSRHGFYDFYFTTPERLRKFLSQFDGRGACMSVEYGMDIWLTGEYSDLNRAMVQQAIPHVRSLIDVCDSSERERDLAQARLLLSKHGVFLEDPPEKLEK
jgi:hypothetical protein